MSIAIIGHYQLVQAHQHLKYEWKGENGDLYKDFYFKVLGPKNHRYKFLDLQHYVRLDFNTFDNNYDDIDVDWRK